MVRVTVSEPVLTTETLSSCALATYSRGARPVWVWPAADATAAGAGPSRNEMGCEPVVTFVTTGVVPVRLTE